MNRDCRSGPGRPVTDPACRMPDPLSLSTKLCVCLNGGSLSDERGPPSLPRVEQLENNVVLTLELEVYFRSEIFNPQLPELKTFSTKWRSSHIQTRELSPLLLKSTELSSCIHLFVFCAKCCGHSLMQIEHASTSAPQTGTDWRLAFSQH